MGASAGRNVASSHTDRRGTPLAPKVRVRRLPSLVLALGLSGAITAGAIAACGGHPAHPGEAPPLAPTPTRGEPARTPVIPVPTADAGAAGTNPQPGPVSINEVPVPSVQAAQEVEDGGVVVPSPTTIVDGGPVDDAYEPPLPPIPDANIPADARIEPEAR